MAPAPFQPHCFSLTSITWPVPALLCLRQGGPSSAHLHRNFGLSPCSPLHGGAGSHSIARPGLPSHGLALPPAPPPPHACLQFQLPPLHHMACPLFSSPTFHHMACSHLPPGLAPPHGFAAVSPPVSSRYDDLFCPPGKGERVRSGKHRGAAQRERKSNPVRLAARPEQEGPRVSMRGERPRQLGRLQQDAGDAESLVRAQLRPGEMDDIAPLPFCLTGGSPHVP